MVLCMGVWMIVYLSLRMYRYVYMCMYVYQCCRMYDWSQNLY